MGLDVPEKITAGMEQALWKDVYRWLEFGTLLPDADKYSTKPAVPIKTADTATSK
jgi:hypothetical protein